MRILFLYMFPLWGNGSASYLRALSKELVSRGHDVAILSPDKRKLNGVKHYVATPPQIGVFSGHPELPKAKKFSDMNGKELGDILVSYLKSSIDAVSDFNPEIIHVFHTAFLPPIGRILKLLFGIRIIITTHGSDLYYLAQDRRFTGLIEDANRYAAAITANSDFTKKLYLEMFGKSLSRKTKVISGGVSLNQFKSTEDTKEYLKQIDRKYNIKGKKVVLFTGRLIDSKGLQYLIKSAPSIEGVVLIIGEGPKRKDMEEEVKRKKISNVIFGGYIGDRGFLHAFYERADVYVTPTVWEGFGLTILEAMASHTPVIASNKGGIVSIIKNNVNGFLVSSRNPKEISTTVNMLFKDEALCKKIGDEAYKTVVENFTWEKITDEFEQLYKQYAFTTDEYLKVVKGEDPRTSRIINTFNMLFGKSDR
ncbi:MAG: glycosyltransferase family 4 protein [bacterium]|nr:glycosyltransferase family 4 protein [bacterium]